MNNQHIQELATICTRYADLRNAAKTTHNNLVKLRMQVFKEMISEDELTVLKNAETIIDTIANYTSQRDAVNYFMNSLENPGSPENPGKEESWITKPQGKQSTKQ